MANTLGFEAPEATAARLAAKRRSEREAADQSLRQQIAQSNQRASSGGMPQRQTQAAGMIGFVRNLRQKSLDAKNRKAMAPIREQHDTLFEQLLADGVPVDRAKAVALLSTAPKLRGLGFNKIATDVLNQGAEALKASNAQALEREKTMSDIQNTDSQRVQRDEELQFASETYVKFDKETGKVSDWTQVPVVDDKRARTLESEGYVMLGGNLAGALNLTTEDFANKQVPGGEAIDNIIAGFSMLENINVLRSVRDQTGFVEGPVRGWAAKFGITMFNNQQFINAIAVGKKMKADVQSLVKGIPSNYDAGIFEAVIPDPTKFAGTPLYDAQLDVIEDNTKSMLGLTIAFHKGTKKAIPDIVVAAARALGVDTGEVAPMSAEDIAATYNDEGKPFSEQNNPFSRHAEAFKKDMIPPDEAQPDPVNAAQESLLFKINAAEKP